MIQMGKVLFVSQNELGRCENLTSVYNAYDGEKEFRCGLGSMKTAEQEGFAAVVCDALPTYIEGKDRCKSIVICHGITGNKAYGLDEDRPVNAPAFEQTDIATAASEASVHLVAQQLGIPESRVIASGFPRTDLYISKVKGDGGTFMADKRACLYAPTFRDTTKRGWLPRIDWEIVDSLLDDDEVFVLKRHYFTPNPLLGSDFKHIIEIEPTEPLTPYLIDCDVLLTDYSSCISDAYLLNKPVVLTCDDMHEYMRDRMMYYDYPDKYSSRWLIAEGHEELLVSTIRKAAQDGLTMIEHGYMCLTAGACDGHSTERTCELIRSCLDG